MNKNINNDDQLRWSRGHKARGQGHKKIQGQGQEQPFRGRPRGQGPRTQAQVFSKKNGLHKFFSGDFQTRKTKTVFANFPRGF